MTGRIRLPHPFVLLLEGVVIAALLTWVVPAGEFERRPDEATGRSIAIAGTYHRVEAAPVGPMGAALAVPRGMVDGAEVIIGILFIGGTFVLLERTGALGRLVGALVGHTRRPVGVLALVATLFSALGALDNMHEEIIALVPVLVLLSRGLGYGAVTALGMSVGAAVVGSAFGPTNPFVAGIAQRFAQLPLLSGGGLRLGMLVAGTALWIWWTASQTSRDDVRPEVAPLAREPVRARDGALLALVMLPFPPYVYGVIALDWGFNELSALFLVTGFAVGLVAGLGLRGTAVEFLKGMETMLAASLFVGISRAISVVFTDGRIIDTIVYALARPLEQVPRFVAAALMVPIHALIHIPVTSNSGQAVLTMPIMAPLADVLGLSRQAAVLAYQTGCGLMDMLTPTNGALLAMLLAADVPYARWLKFAVPGVLIVSIVGFVALAISL
jgi:uncharacterized ion transporter superfamily protein YfcC